MRDFHQTRFPSARRGAAVIIAAIAVACALFVPLAAQAQPPNVLVLLADDIPTY